MQLLISVDVGLNTGREQQQRGTNDLMSRKLLSWVKRTAQCDMVQGKKRLRDTVLENLLCAGPSLQVGTASSLGPTLNCVFRVTRNSTGVALRSGLRFSERAESCFQNPSLHC